MKFITLFIGISTLLCMTSAYTFIIPVEKDDDGKSYITYEGQSYELSDLNGKQTKTFMDGDCLVFLNLAKSDEFEFREGYKICKSMFQNNQQIWDEFVAKQLEHPGLAN